MDIKKMGLIGSAVLVMASLGMAFSNTPTSARPTPAKAARPAATVTAPEAEPLTLVPPAPVAVAPAAQAAPAAIAQDETKLGLVAPPAVMPKAGKKSAVKPVAAGAVVAKADAKSAAKADAKAAKADTKVAAKGAPKTQAAQAGVAKPKNLFSYVRTLSYSPHPQEEEFLRDKPLTLNGSEYYISVAYREKWDALDDEDGRIKAVGFDINIFQDGKKVRTLKVPEFTLKPGKLQKGQVIGLAEVAPYKFKIAIHDFTSEAGGFSDLTFKFDMSS